MIIEYLIKDIIWAFIFAASSISFTRVLMDVDRPFYWYRKLLDKINVDCITYPLGHCEVCLSGQVSLWMYLLLFYGDATYVWYSHIYTVLITMLFTDQLNKKFYD